MPDESVNIKISKSLLNSVKQYWFQALVMILLGGEGTFLVSDNFFQDPSREYTAVVPRCNSEGCIYMDEDGHSHPARRGDTGEWIYQSRGRWFYTVDGSEYEGH